MKKSHAIGVAMKILKRVNLHGHSVRVVELGETRYKAQIKLRHEKRFRDFCYEAETMDHAFFWAFQAIENYFQDGKTWGK